MATLPIPAASDPSKKTENCNPSSGDHARIEKCPRSLEMNIQKKQPRFANWKLKYTQQSFLMKSHTLTQQDNFIWCIVDSSRSIPKTLANYWHTHRSGAQKISSSSSAAEIFDTDATLRA